jgi:NO-binding membrane sensor protein with MHYT domain
MKERRFYLIAVIVIIGLGIASRKIMGFPYPVYEYAGDILWGMNLYMVFRLIFPRENIPMITFISFTTSVLVEFSQLYHAPWIDSFRDTFIGAMLLGYGFLWSDILCYAIGTALGVITDVVYLSRKKKNEQRI